MGKSSINGPFSMAVLNNQRVIRSSILTTSQNIFRGMNRFSSADHGPTEPGHGVNTHSTHHENTNRLRLFICADSLVQIQTKTSEQFAYVAPF